MADLNNGYSVPCIPLDDDQYIFYFRHNGTAYTKHKSVVSVPSAATVYSVSAAQGKIQSYSQHTCLPHFLRVDFSLLEST